MSASRVVLTCGLALALVTTGCTTGIVPPARHASPPPSAAGEPVITSPVLTSSMRRISAELMRAGLRPDTHAFAGFLPNGNHATFPVRVPANTCATIIALATQNVSDVDAALYTPEGELVVSDAEPDSHPTLQVCTGNEPRALYYVMQLFDGDGSFVVLPFYGTRATLGAAARVMGGRPAFAEAARGRELSEDPVLSLREGMRKRGFTQVGDPIVFGIANDERVRTGLPANAATCYTVAAFGSDGVHELALRVLDEHGEPVGEGEGAGSEAALQLCARQSASYVVETQARNGTGHVTLLVFRADVVVAGGDAGLWLGHRIAAKSN